MGELGERKREKGEERETAKEEKAKLKCNPMIIFSYARERNGKANSNGNVH